MGFFSAIASFASGAFAAIGGAIGGALAVFSSPQVMAISLAIKAIATTIGLISKNQEPEEIGDKVYQAEEKGIKPEKFDKFEEYQKEIDNFKLDPKKSEEISTDDKLKKFIEYAGMGIADKFEVDPTKLITNEIVKNNKFYTDERVCAYVEAFGETKTPLDEISKYMDGDISDINEIKSVRNTLIDGEKRIPGNEGKNDVELLEIINDEKRV